jgi:hypothetical protein
VSRQIALLVLAAAFLIGGPAAAQTSTRNGKAYQLVEWDRLATYNHPFGWGMDSPSLFADMRIVTLGWSMVGCDRFDSYPQLLPPNMLSRNPFTDPRTIKLDWTHVTGKNIVEETAKCDAVVARRHSPRAQMVLLLLYGVFRNGTGENDDACTGSTYTVRGCNHLEIERVEFTGTIQDDKTPDARDQAILQDLLVAGGKEVLKRLVTRGN